MSEIPETTAVFAEMPADILNSAASAVESMPQRAPFKADVLLAIARAIVAERERCAKTAETIGVYPELNVFSGGPEWYRHGKNIAAAIRLPSPPSKEGE